MIKKGIGIIFLLLFYALIYKILMPRLNAFGCFDDCSNFIPGYFLLHGKVLYSQIFYNHAPFIANLSAFVQWLTHPHNLHELILRHRQFLLIFGLVSAIVLFVRFGWVVIPFILLYELTKFYLFGDRFLAEGFIVYPLAFLFAVALHKLIKGVLHTYDFVLCAVCGWFVLYMREPYWLVTLFLLGVVFWTRKLVKFHMLSLGLFFLLTLITLLAYNIPEFFYNVVYVNQWQVRAENTDTGILGINIYKSFLYPALILFQTHWSFFGIIEIGLASIFFISSALLLWKKQWKVLAVLWVGLGLANLRLVAPGTEYYGAFHALVWYGLTIFTTAFLLQYVWTWKKSLFVLEGAGFLFLILFSVVSKDSYVHDHVDQQYEFITNYGNVLQVGNVVAALSTPKDTLFLDGFDDTIYFTAQRYSRYTYSWYTSLMPEFSKYTNARYTMFVHNPPDFYYGSCPKQKDPRFLLPSFIHNQYIRLYNLDKLSCLWVKKTKLASISSAKWQEAGKSLYFRQPTKQ